MEQREFLDVIRGYRRRLNLAGFLKMLAFALGVGACAGIILQALAFIVPVYYVNVYTGITILLAVLSASAVSVIKRSTMEHAALVMDSFGFKERIVTAYEHLGDEGEMIVLQRRDAMAQLKANRGRIKIPLLPPWKKTAISAALLLMMMGLALAPSQMKDRAKELHQVKQEAWEKEKEIREVLDELEKLEEQEQDTLTPEQLAALQEMIDSLKSSMAEYQQISSADALQAAGEKLNYKYENMSSQMANLAQNIQNGTMASTVSAESLQAMADKLQQMSGNPSMGNGVASNQGQNGNGQNNQNGQNSQNGQGDSQGDGQGSGQGDGQGNGQGSGQGDGQGGGQGSGQGDGQGNGQGGGQGSGQGNGQGRGTGSANIARDYVSIPNAIADSENLTGSAVDHDNSDYFRAQNGLSWEGTRMSYEAVIGSYEQNAYEGIAAGQYPTGMENVIKDYFSSFNN